MLEQQCHSDSCFVTLTYRDEHLPGGLENASLQRIDITNWLKRLRHAIEPSRIRYYGCGEYGDVTWRPHYHAAIFGYPCCQYGLSRYNQGKQTCCSTCDLIRDTWGRGNILVGSLEIKSAQYVASYVTKKMTRRDDSRLKGREPEFSFMSLVPGIGARFVPEIASSLMTFDLDTTQADVPVSLRHGSRMLPLGRYMRQQIRKQIGKEITAPRDYAQEAEMLVLQEAAKRDPENISLKKQLLAKNKGKVQALLARQRVFKQRRSL